MVVPKPSWKDGTRMTNTESPSQTLCGLESKLSSLTKLHWKTTPILQHQRPRNEKIWFLSLNQEGVQGPMNQRPDFVEAKRKCKRMHDEHVEETSEGNTPIHPKQRTRQRRDQQFEGIEE